MGHRAHHPLFCLPIVLVFVVLIFVRVRQLFLLQLCLYNIFRRNVYYRKYFILEVIRHYFSNDLPVIADSTAKFSSKLSCEYLECNSDKTAESFFAQSANKVQNFQTNKEKARNIPLDE